MNITFLMSDKEHIIEEATNIDHAKEIIEKVTTNGCTVMWNNCIRYYPPSSVIHATVYTEETWDVNKNGTGPVDWDEIVK
jgi:hypothetical protein